MMNLITRTGWEARLAAATGDSEADGEGRRRRHGSRRVHAVRLRGAADEPRARHLGLRGEVRSARAEGIRKADRCASVDLNTRLLKYPCSYMIYSAAFDAMPALAKSAVYRKLLRELPKRENGAAALKFFEPPDPICLRLSADMETDPIGTPNPGQPVRPVRSAVPTRRRRDGRGLPRARPPPWPRRRVGSPSGRRLADADHRARFEREARALAALSHPNVAVIYGLEEFGDTQVMVQEYVDGETLADRVASGPLAIADAASIAADVAGALFGRARQGHRPSGPQAGERDGHEGGRRESARLRSRENAARYLAPANCRPWRPSRSTASSSARRPT